MGISEKQTAMLEEIGKKTGKPILEWVMGMATKRTAELDATGIDSKQVVMKTEDGSQYPARCYAYVPDEEQVSTWKLRLCAPGTTEITREQLGAAAAAFSPGGFRGQRVELPNADVARVKRRIRDAYAKLDVSKEEIPESIKSLFREVEVEDKLKMLSEKVKAMCSSDLKGRMTTMLEDMQKAEDNAVVATLRQLMELIAEVDDVELRAQLEEMVTSMQDEASMEDAVEEAMEDQMEKAVPDVKSLVKAELATYEFDKLEEYLQAEKAYSEKALSDLATAIKALSDQVQTTTQQLAALDEEVKAIKEDDEKRIDEKMKRTRPFWGGFDAARVAQTVVNEEEAKQYARPEVPAAIARLAQH